ncbi:hypothetical protein [Corallococcus terminator]|nr:hypothetical protein [Corallococcus terminator]
MWRGMWVVAGLFGWAACSGNEGVEPEDPEARKQKLRGCILQKLPPAQVGAEAWTVSGYVLVEAYARCLDAGETSTAADFRAVTEGMADLQAEPSWVRITASPGSGG